MASKPSRPRPTISVDDTPTATQTYQLDWIQEGTGDTNWCEAYVPDGKYGLVYRPFKQTFDVDALAACVRAGWVQSEEHEYRNASWKDGRRYATAYRLVGDPVTGDGARARARGREARTAQYDQMVPSTDHYLFLEALSGDLEAGNGNEHGWVPTFLPKGGRSLAGRTACNQAIMRYGWTEWRHSPLGVNHGREYRLTDMGRRALVRGRAAAQRMAARKTRAAAEGRTIDGVGLGDQVEVCAYGAWRPGRVTDIAKTRLKVDFRQNQQGGRGERWFTRANFRKVSGNG